MSNLRQHKNWIFATARQVAISAIAFAIVFGLADAARAQTFRVLHVFGGGGNDGALAYSGVTMDATGNLYGTTYNGGMLGWGVVYKLTHTGNSWTVGVINDFALSGGGIFPVGGVVFGPNGSLYGTTNGGGSNGRCGMGCGSVFSLRPSPTAGRTPSAPWVLTLLYYFDGGPGGGSPEYGDLAFDASGAIYGTASIGGAHNTGVVFQLKHSDQGYVESAIQSFTGPNGFYPYGSVVFDRAGNLYTTAFEGGANDGGAVVELTPSDGGWAGNVIYSFAGSNDGYNPKAGLVVDRSGNLYGTTFGGAYPGYSNGTVFELTPSNGGWQESILHAFPFAPQQLPGGPVSPVVMDAAGNLYGATTGGGAFGWGTIFQLTPSGGGWTYRDLHDFSGPDGTNPYGALALDPNGNLYGTTSLGGSSCNCGVVWELQMH